MQLLGLILFVAIVSAVLQSVAKILVLLTLVALAWGFVTKPAEITASLIGLMCFGLVARYPYIGVPAVVILASVRTYG